MAGPEAVSGLPTLVALDALAVLAGERDATSLHLSETYFRGQARALESVAAPGLDRRREMVENSLALLQDVQVDFDSLTEANLREASRRYRDVLRRIPEVQYLERAFPGTCFVVPEWLRVQGEVQYGARVYFVGEDGPTPGDVVEENVAAVVAGDRAAFEAFLGDLHGYPECCVAAFQDRPADGPTPEKRAVDPLADRIVDDRLGEGSETSVDEVFEDLFATPFAYAFFTREFYPGPGCSTATNLGVAVFDRLTAHLPHRLVRDFFRFNVGYSYLAAQAIARGADSAPAPGALGREHDYLYLPLGATLDRPRYRDARDS